PCVLAEIAGSIERFNIRGQIGPDPSPSFGALVCSVQPCPDCTNPVIILVSLQARMLHRWRKDSPDRPVSNRLGVDAENVRQFAAGNNAPRRAALEPAPIGFQCAWVKFWHLASLRQSRITDTLIEGYPIHPAWKFCKWRFI